RDERRRRVRRRRRAPRSVARRVGDRRGAKVRAGRARLAGRARRRCLRPCFRFDSGRPEPGVDSAAMKRTMNDVHDGRCSVAATAEIVATKWTPLIVHDLSEGPRRFMQLEHACPGISPRTLSERLDMLERQGVVIRRSYPESPPRVEYELTAKGRALLPIIREMRKFGRAWMLPEAAKARGRAELKLRWSGGSRSSALAGSVSRSSAGS